MTVIQGSYDQYFDASYPGNFAFTNTLNDWISKITETAIPFGFGVVSGASDVSVKLPSAAGQRFKGIVRRTLARSNSDNIETASSEAGTFSDIITNGYVSAVCEDGCSGDDDVFFRHTDNGSLLAGGFRTDADTANADQIIGARWEKTTAAGEIGIIKLGQGV